MEQKRRIAAYGICRDEDGRVLLTRASAFSDTPGVWQVPGGDLKHGEHPEWAVVREFAEQTGLAVRATGLHTVLSDVAPLPFRDLTLHHDRVIFDVAMEGGDLRHEADGSIDLVRWVERAELGTLPLLPFTARLLGVPANAELVEETLRTAARVGLPETVATPSAGPRGQRFAAYGLVTDPEGRVLLTKIAGAYPGAGRWHLPGGGTDFGEQPDTGFLRELVEEAGQHGRVTGLLRVSHRRNPAARGPEGHPIDWHSVRVTYTAVVDEPTPPVVTEAAGGSTAEARWFSPAEARTLALSDVAQAALEWLHGQVRAAPAPRR
ncbi:ADP-ribose pyrophosphatase YjhB (NUDIX family) [Catenuloplanes nepalensis]|uniref:ADP-ribose pyrophosphatase YjhB (NUDIX family) n=1 Tax=Catenuloplanes nepalensis TaxID=587533 RepID=A0ABT9N6C2_9ACTN|nr:NUDIX domain-containing protein [Catenuloplanes nepalensis]MDP9799239.1 ADP-ribose pyrophosphatase YjhB (NUDIX family) [Catenuloplanes nepalensis]